MSQPQPTQQHEFPKMLKQCKEPQQKRQLQKLGYLGQQNHVDQLCLFNKQTPGIQVPPLFDGNRFRDSPNMFSTIRFPCQNQAAPPMQVLPHQPNMSTYRSPVVGLGNNLSPQPSLQGLRNGTSILTDSNVVQMNKGVRIMAGSGASVGEQCNSLSLRGYKDLRFPSKTRGDQLEKDISQIVVCDSTEMDMLGQPNETVSTGGISSNKVKEGKLSLRIAPSGLKHQRNSKKRQILSMLAAKNTSHQLPVDQNFDIRRSKKRKVDSFDFLPWHKEVTQGSLKFPDFSMIELEWCLASNRRSERVENEVEVLQDSAMIHRPKRRLTKSTQLMQQLFPPSPTVIFSADAFSSCDSVVYFVARLALGDACNMACDLRMQSTAAGDMLYGKVETPGKDLLNTMETFICRVERLRADIIRLEERASFLDLKLQSQEMDKFATIHRLASFHSKGNAAAVEASTVTPAVLKPALQRYVVEFPMPKTVPRGVKYLSL